MKLANIIYTFICLCVSVLPIIFGIIVGYTYAAIEHSALVLLLFMPFGVITIFCAFMMIYCGLLGIINDSKKQQSERR